jgi:hypothetical protein
MAHMIGRILTLPMALLLCSWHMSEAHQVLQPEYSYIQDKFQAHGNPMNNAYSAKHCHFLVWKPSSTDHQKLQEFTRY